MNEEECLWIRDVNGREFCAIAQTRDFFVPLYEDLLPEFCAIGKKVPGIIFLGIIFLRNKIPRNNIPEE